MSNKTYDVLKKIVLVYLPAFITFAGVVLNTIGYEYTDAVLTILAAFDTFLGSVLGISNMLYEKDKDNADNNESR